MNDFITPIMKLLSSLVSVRAAFRYLFVASGLLLSWMKIPPLLLVYNLPGQISGIVTTLIGVGIGTIVSALIFFLIDGIASICKTRKDNRIKAKNEQNEKDKRDKENNEFVTMFKHNFEHYDFRAQEIIEMLSEKEGSLSLVKSHSSDPGPDAIKGLYSNSVILLVMNINKHTAVYKLNPLLKDWVCEYFYNRYHNNATDFLADLTPAKKSLLNIMSERSEYPKEPLPYPKEFFTTPYMFMPCFEANFEDEATSFYFSFRKVYREHFESILNKEFYDEVEVILS